MKKTSPEEKHSTEEPRTGQDENLRAFLACLEQERNASFHTLESYRMDIEQFAKAILKCDPAKGPVNWEDAGVYDARSFVLFLQEEKLQKSSMNRKISALRSFYRFMQREDRCSGNPFLGLTSPKRPKKLPRYMTVAEVGRLLDAPAAYWAHPTGLPDRYPRRGLL